MSQNGQAHLKSCKICKTFKVCLIILGHHALKGSDFNVFSALRLGISNNRHCMLQEKNFRFLSCWGRPRFSFDEARPSKSRKFGLAPMNVGKNLLERRSPCGTIASFFFQAPTCSTLFEFSLAFSHFKNFEFACCLGGFHLRIALHLQESALF